ncbi:MAG: D-2-hydroxyacid dehydrogenase [Roseimicrobium sp.]
MNLTILDAYTANPGDLSWGGLQELATCTVHDRTPPAEVIARAQDCELMLTNKTVLSRETLLALPKLRYIGVLATDYNVVDIATARERGIVVANVPGYSTPSVAQTVFALLLELTHRVGHHSQTVHEGRWSRCADFCYWEGTLIELAGRTFGIIGYGTIGESVARIALALGMNVIAHRRTWKTPPLAGVDAASVERVFAHADVLSLHCPLTEETKHLIRRETLALMQPTAFLINTARGPLVNEADLAEALNASRLAGAGLDVLSTEPPAADNPLLGAKNCIITPHIAWASKEARQRLIAIATANVAGFLRGHAQNVV